MSADPPKTLEEIAKGPATGKTSGGAKTKTRTAGYPPVPEGWWCNPVTGVVEPRPPTPP